MGEAVAGRCDETTGVGGVTVKAFNCAGTLVTTTTTDNVGIGTTTPATTFEVVKSSNRSPLMISSNAVGAGDFLKIDCSIGLEKFLIFLAFDCIQLLRRFGSCREVGFDGLAPFGVRRQAH